MGAGAFERELKYHVGEAFAMPYLGGKGLTHVPGVRRALDAQYWDTPDLRLTRRGHSLRHRCSDDGTENEWTLKLADSSPGRSLVRREVTQTGTASCPPSTLVDALVSLLGPRTLEPVCNLRSDRSTSYLVDADGARHLTVEDDHVSVLDGSGSVVARFREIEAELADGGDPRELRRVEKRLRRSGAPNPDPVPKVARALGELARRPVIEPLSLDVTVEGLVAHSLRDGLERLLANDPAVRLELGPEGVHQARVATRRLRADLRTLRPLLQKDVVEPLRAELAWVGGCLGAVRDLDVLIDEVRAAAAELDEPPDLAPVITLIERSRADARRELLAAMSSDRYRDVLVQLEHAIAVPPLGADIDPAQRANKVTRRLLMRSWHRLEELATAVDNDSPAEEWHEIRKKAKGTRYAAELLAPLLGDRALDLAAAAKKIQDELGRSNDAVNARHWLREHATTPNAAFVSGRLDAVFDAGGGDARDQWPRLWKRATQAADRM